MERSTVARSEETGEQITDSNCSVSIEGKALLPDALSSILTPEAWQKRGLRCRVRSNVDMRLE